MAPWSAIECISPSNKCLIADCNGGQVLQYADTHNIDTSRIGLWGASAGANLAAALAVKYSQEKDTQFAGLSVSLVSLVVPVAGHPKAFSRFSKNRKFPKSDNEALFEEESPPSEHVIAGAEKLLGMVPRSPLLYARLP